MSWKDKLLTGISVATIAGGILILVVGNPLGLLLVGVGVYAMYRDHKRRTEGVSKGKNHDPETCEERGDPSRGP